MMLQRLVRAVEGLGKGGERDGGGGDVAPTWTCNRIPGPHRSKN